MPVDMMQAGRRDLSQAVVCLKDHDRIGKPHPEVRQNEAIADASAAGPDSSVKDHNQRPFDDELDGSVIENQTDLRRSRRPAQLALNNL